MKGDRPKKIIIIIIIIVIILIVIIIIIIVIIIIFIIIIIIIIVIVIIVIIDTVSDSDKESGGVGCVGLGRGVWEGRLCVINIIAGVLKSENDCITSRKEGSLENRKKVWNA